MNILEEVSLVSSRFFNVARCRHRAEVSAFLSLFCLMTTCSMLRPVRDEMGVIVGTEDLPVLFAVQVIILIMVSRFVIKNATGSGLNRTALVVVCSLLIFDVLLTANLNPKITAPIFFGWFGIFNVLIIMLFWIKSAKSLSKSGMARFIGPITSGGSTGALAGPILTALCVPVFGFSGFMLLSAVMAALGFYFLNRLSVSGELTGSSIEKKDDVSTQLPVHGGMFLMIFLQGSIYMILYFELIHLMKTEFDSSEQRTSVFAFMDATAGTISFAGQWLFTYVTIKKIGLKYTLAITPMLMVGGIIIFLIHSNLATLWGLVLIFRIGHNIWVRPCRELLYSRITCGARNSVSAIFHRSGDVLIASVITTVPLPHTMLIWWLIPLVSAWIMVIFIVGKSYGNNFKTIV